MSTLEKLDLIETDFNKALDTFLTNPSLKELHYYRIERMVKSSPATARCYLLASKAALIVMIVDGVI